MPLDTILKCLAPLITHVRDSKAYGYNMHGFEFLGSILIKIFFFFLLLKRKIEKVASVGP